MRTIVNPRQTPMFDSFGPVLTARTRDCLLADWQGVFRHVILELMPVDALGGAFDPSMGRPTKELYSMAGLLVIKEFMNWTKTHALDAYRFNMGVHFALNLDPVAHDLSLRTLERYENIFIENDLAGHVMHEVTTTLVRECGIRVDAQRLDSTHIFSNMASFGRTRLMGVTIKRFLTQLKRHDAEAYSALADDLRRRYEPSTHRLFGDTVKDQESRHLLREQVAQDMYALVRRFADDETHRDRATYKTLERVFYEQCEVEEETVRIRKKTGGNVIQNPSDPDATYDGHKGPGYQAQIAETCHPDNEVELITSAMAQTAVESDTAALPAVLDDLQEQGLLPESMLADTLYGSDENVQKAETKGVELVSPTQEGARELSGAESTEPYDALTTDDFVIDEDTEAVTACPAGIAPERSTHDRERGKTTTVMAASACGACDFSGECPIRKVKGTYRIEHTAKQHRLASRRREERTAPFRERYRLRAGIEGTNSGLKRRVGLARLRVRGSPRVFNAILLKLAGWNILQATACAKLRAKVAEIAKSVGFGLCFSAIMARIALYGLYHANFRGRPRQICVFGLLPAYRPAA
jgi:Transposase DDE domain